MLFKDSRHLELKSNLSIHIDFLSISAEVFNLFKGWYGVDYPICRKMRIIEGDLELDVSTVIKPSECDDFENSKKGGYSQRKIGQNYQSAVRMRYRNRSPNVANLKMQKDDVLMKSFDNRGSLRKKKGQCTIF